MHCLTNLSCYPKKTLYSHKSIVFPRENCKNTEIYIFFLQAHIISVTSFAFVCKKFCEQTPIFSIMNVIYVLGTMQFWTFWKQK